MDKIALEAKAIKAFENLASARTALFMAAEVTIMDKFTLEKQRAELTASGKIDGKNAETREAQVREILSDQYLSVAAAEAAEREARRDFDLASMEADAVRTLVRIAELP